MADQARWFKFWCTAPYDDHLLRLSVADRWAWAVLGAYTKAHGTRGSVQLSESNTVLAAAMGIDVTVLFVTCARLPHLSVQKSDNGEITVTWKNWTKYQEDSTVAERVSRLRSKKRREENIKAVPPNPQRFAHANVTAPSSDNGADHDQRKRDALALLNRAYPGLKPPSDG